MELLDNIRKASGDQLLRLARSIADNKTALYSVVVGLAESGTAEDYERIATVLSCATVNGTENTEFYSDRRGAVGKGYVDIFTAACNACDYPESEYIKVLLYAQYARRGGDLYGWNDGVDAYLEKLAKTDFELAAEYINKYDDKFGKFDVLIRTDPSKSVALLLDKVLYEKNINKTAIRRILMDRPEIINALIAAYGGSTAKSRAAIVRILLLFKTDERVKQFLKTAEADESKTVRALFEKREAKPTDAAAFFENLMSSGEPISYGRLLSLLSDKHGTKGKTSADGKACKKGSGKSRRGTFAAVADRIFFYTSDGVDKTIIIYNDGRFTDLGGNAPDCSSETSVYVLHPLDVAQDSQLLTLGIAQPFLQLSRPTYFALPGETGVSSRLMGTLISKTVFDNNFKRCGFAYSADEGEALRAVKLCGDYAVGVKCRISDDGTAECLSIEFFRASDLVKLGRDVYIGSANAVSIPNVPRRAYSELIYSAYKLFGCAE